MVDIKINNIIRARRRTLALIINPDATLTVKAPFFTPQFFIDRFVKEKEEWIRKKMVQIQMHPKAEKKQFVNGEQFLFLGKSYQLKIVDHSAIVLGESLFFPFKFNMSIKKRLLQWYKDRSLQHVTARVKGYATVMNVDYKTITLSNAKLRWGACTGTNELSFNWRLIMAPLDIMDYVVVHELAHIFEKNHSKKFWALVFKYCPDYKLKRKWLKVNGKALEVI